MFTIRKIRRLIRIGLAISTLAGMISTANFKALAYENENGYIYEIRNPFFSDSDKAILKQLNDEMNAFYRANGAKDFTFSHAFASKDELFRFRRNLVDDEITCYYVYCADGTAKFGIPEDAMRALFELDREDINNKLDTMYSQIGIVDTDTQMQKAIKINDYVRSWCLAMYPQGGSSGAIPSGTSALYYVLSGQGLCCRGYDTITAELYDRAGIKNCYEGGSVIGGAHCWNMAEIDGEMYYIDNGWNLMCKIDELPSYYEIY